MKIFVETSFQDFVADFIDVQLYIWAWTKKVFAGTSFWDFIGSLPSQFFQLRFLIILHLNDKPKKIYCRVDNSGKCYIGIKFDYWYNQIDIDHIDILLIIW